MLGSEETRRRWPRDFVGYYMAACAAQGSAPLPALRTNPNPDTLDFNGDIIALHDWTPVLSALSINKQLQSVTIRSCYLSTLGSQVSSRRRTPAIHSKGMTLQLCKALQKTLCISPNLKTLQLYGLPLRERDLNFLTKGLAKSVSLEHLSLSHCPIADKGLETICQSVKYSTTLRTVDFSSCNITWHGAEHMANIIKHQAMKRHTTAWAESLRYRRAEFEAMGGLRRITLNDNILVGDRGVTALAQELAEDLWVKAVDLQRCGISNEGARVLEKMLASNSTLCVLDVRRNPLVDNELVKTVIKKVLMNTNGQDPQYLWLKPPAKDSHEPSGQATRRNAGRTVHKLGSRRVSLGSGGRRPTRPGTAGYIPWRTAARATLQRGLPPGARSGEKSFQNASTIRITLETESESELELEEAAAAALQRPRENITSSQFRRLQTDYKRLQVELEDCKLRLAQERNTRVKADSRLMELELENNRLRALNQRLTETQTNRSVLEEEQVLESIESSFQKFHAFLDLLKDAGLGQMASLAGIEQSDFELVGHPQLSSTERKQHGDRASEERREDPMATEHPQRTSRPPSSRSSSRSSAASRAPSLAPSQQDLPLAPAVSTETASGPPERAQAPELQLGLSLADLSRVSGSHQDDGGGSGSRPGSSAASSVRSDACRSYTEDFSEVSQALSSRSSGPSQLGSTQGQGGLFRLTGF